jgi:LemA protein
MSTSQIFSLVVAAVLVFWAVGAYNRLVRLRNDIARAYVSVEAQVEQRHGLLLSWTDALRPMFDESQVWVDAVVASADQLRVAAEQTRLRPSAPSLVASLRLAEDTLSAASARLLGDLPAHLHQTHLSVASLGLAGFNDQIAEAGASLAFARRQFNGAVEQYNEAVMQFPTVLIASLFGFRPAGAL